MPVLYVFSGLPGAGKTTASQLFAQVKGVLHLRIDTVEQGLRDLCAVGVQGEGYELCYRIAADNLRLGLDVIADSCNPIELTRRAWEQVSIECGARHVNVQVVCSDLREHRRRVEGRESSIPGLAQPSWEAVQQREYDAWSTERIVIDTAAKLPAQCVDELMRALPGPG